MQACILTSQTGEVQGTLINSLPRLTGVSLRYILDFGAQPLERQMLLSARFLHQARTAGLVC